MNKHQPTRRLVTCLRCGYSWFTQLTDDPRQCTQCKSPYWNTPRQREVKPRA